MAVETMATATSAWAKHGIAPSVLLSSRARGSSEGTATRPLRPAPRRLCSRRLCAPESTHTLSVPQKGWKTFELWRKKRREKRAIGRGLTDGLLIFPRLQIPSHESSFQLFSFREREKEWNPRALRVTPERRISLENGGKPQSMGTESPFC